MFHHIFLEFLVNAKGRKIQKAKQKKRKKHCAKLKVPTQAFVLMIKYALAPKYPTATDALYSETASIIKW